MPPTSESLDADPHWIAVSEFLEKWNTAAETYHSLALRAVALQAPGSPKDDKFVQEAQAADAERRVQTNRASGYRIHVLDNAAIAQAHDRSLAELFFNLSQSGGERLFAIVIHYFFAITEVKS